MEIPTTIGRLTDLEFVALSGNQIETIPTEFGLLTKLYILRVPPRRRHLPARRAIALAGRWRET